MNLQSNFVDWLHLFGLKSKISLEYRGSTDFEALCLVLDHQILALFVTKTIIKLVNYRLLESMDLMH